MVKEVVARFGSLDVLVNNAGITKDGLMAVSYTHLDVYKRQVEIWKINDLQEPCFRLEERQNLTWLCFFSVE